MFDLSCSEIATSVFSFVLKIQHVVVCCSLWVSDHSACLKQHKDHTDHHDFSSEISFIHLPETQLVLVFPMHSTSTFIRFVCTHRLTLNLLIKKRLLCCDTENLISGESLYKTCSERSRGYVLDVLIFKQLPR